MNKQTVFNCMVKIVECVLAVSPTNRNGNRKIIKSTLTNNLMPPYRLDNDQAPIETQPEPEQSVQGSAEVVV